MTAQLNPDQTARQWVDVLCERHARFFREKPHGSLTPMIMMLYPDGKIDMLLCPWGDAEEREITLIVLRSAINALKVVRYAFFAETWMSEVASKDHELPKDLRPSQDPNRVEAVFTIVCDRRLAEPAVARQRMVRGPDGAVLRLEREPDLTNLHMSGGAIASLFDREEALQ